MRSKIVKILGVREAAPTLFITTIIDEDGNTATGVGKDFKVGDAIITYFDDKHNKCKFYLIA